MARQVSLAVALLTTAAWLLWAEHAGGGGRVVLTTAALWWLAALQATWRVWLPAVVVLAGLYAAIPPRVPRRRSLQPAVVTPRPVAPPPLAAIPADREPVREPPPEAPQTVTPASVPAPVRTVWDAFTVVPRSEGSENDDDAA